MRKEYNKLIRDHIPDLIRKEGRDCEVITMSKGEFRQALLQKLTEEAQEAASSANLKELITELADLYEVMDTVMEEYEIDKESILVKQELRRKERGGFSKRYRLVWTQ
jgi:predicted house-cleaning noncanonical NTP pyrophosphatase (MazG superfamily)